MDSRAKLLLGILAFVGLFAVWTWFGPGDGLSEEKTRPPGRVARAGRLSATSRAPVERVEEPLFAALAVRPRESVPGRDPWRFGEPPRPARLVRPSATQPVPAPIPPRAPAPAAVQPAPPAFPWTYLGSFGPADRRIAVFSDGSAVHNRREGEILAERFVLERIGIESVDVRPLRYPGAPAQRLAPGAGQGRGTS